MTRPLTESQQRLPAEIRDSSTGGLYIRRTGRSYRAHIAKLRVPEGW